jgi:hypothetical protein
MLVVLNSVASAIDDETFITYAMYDNGNIDKESGTPLDRCSAWWYDSLNNKDREMVTHLLGIKKNLERRS